MCLSVAFLRGEVNSHMGSYADRTKMLKTRPAIGQLHHFIDANKKYEYKIETFKTRGM